MDTSSDPKMGARVRELRLRIIYGYQPAAISVPGFAIVLAFLIKPKTVGILGGFLILLFGFWCNRSPINKVILSADPKGAKVVIPTTYFLTLAYMGLSFLVPDNYDRLFAAASLPLMWFINSYSPYNRGTLDAVIKELLRLNVPTRADKAS